MNDNTEIDIEIQLSNMRSWADRSTFYLCHMVAEQSNINRMYSNMKKCAAINILDFNYMPETKRFHTIYHVREDKEHILFTDKMEWHIIELRKLPLNEDGTKLYDWARFLKSERREDFEMLAKRDAYLDEAYKQLNIISQDKLKRIEYTSRQKALNDYTTLMAENYDRGLEEGRVEGITEGIEKERSSTIARMKALGFTDEQIRAVYGTDTGL